MSLTYANGAAPDSALTFIDGLHVVPSIAPRVEAFIAYAKSQGKTLRIAHPYGGYRTLGEQRKLTGTGNSASTIPVAAAGKSTHGVYATGRVDFVGADGYTYNSTLLAWIVANAGKFGLVREFGTADPNHFMASGAFTTTATTSATSKEIDMTWARDTMVIRNTKTGGIVALEPFAVNDWGGNQTALDNAGMSAGQPEVNGHYWIDLDDTTYSVYLDQHRHHLDALRTLLASAAGALNVDEAALAADLAKLLPGVSKTDLRTATQQIIAAIPTSFTAK